MHVGKGSAHISRATDPTHNHPLAIMRVSLADYLAGYDLTRGALFPIGLALMAFAPVIGRKFSRN